MDELLNQSWTGTAVGIVIGVIATVAVAYVFKSRPRLAAKANTSELVGPNSALPTEIAFLFRGVPVPKVTLSKVAIWNSGNTTLKGDQIVASDPLRIVVSEGGSILETTIPARTRKANDVVCGLRADTTNELECRFDFLDPGDGVVIQLIHTGTDSVRVVGTFRGIPQGVQVVGTPRTPTPLQPTETSRGVAKTVAAGVFLLGIVLPILKGAGGLKPTERWSTIALASGLLILLSAGALFLSRYMPPERLSTQIGSGEAKKP